MAQIEDRILYSKANLEKLSEELLSTSEYLRDVASIFATGSYGRHEACEFSDLDAFIVHVEKEQSPRFSNLEAICVKYILIKSARELALPDFSGDGEYLQVFSCEEMIKEIGSTRDDVQNTFTARLLLLLESKCLSNHSVHELSVNRIIDAYWRDYEGHESDFRPTYLLNDILRLWRTFCINYEARTKTEPQENKIKRKIKNYKLKHSRLMTCYSAIFYIVYLYGKNNTVSKNDVYSMSTLTPVERLNEIVKISKNECAVECAKNLLIQYEEFLFNSNHSEGDLREMFADEIKAKELAKKGYEFSEKAYDLLMAIGKENALLARVVI